MPSITVIITAYRLEKHLKLCFDDLLAQTFQDFDVVVLDDASPDATPDIIREYAARYPERIRPLLQTVNSGSPSKARNAVLRSGMITGQYTLFLDGDDRIEPEMLAQLYALARAENADMTICAFDRTDATNQRVLSHDLKWLGETIALPPENDWFAFVNGALWNKMIRTSIMQGLEIPEFSFGEDICFGLMLAMRAKRIATTPAELIHYQVRAQSVSTSLKQASVQNFAQELRRMYTEAENPQWKQLLAFVAYLHIGLSMATRAVAKMTEMPLREYVRWSRRFLLDNFDLQRHCPYLRLRNLLRHGLKGLIIWLSYRCMRIRAMGWLLRAYELLRRGLGIEVKF